MPKCSYCGKTYDIPHGLTLVLNDGKIKHLCSSKCRKNRNMNRRKVRWISKRKETKKDIQEEIKAESKQQEQESQEKKEVEKSSNKNK